MKTPSRALVIAEVGSCHDRSLGLAEKLIWKAKAGGADCVKFQYWSSAARLAERRHSGLAYQQIYEEYQMPQDWIPRLAGVAARAQIGFMCTSYTQEDIAVVAPYVAHYKVASFEAADMDFIRAHYEFLRNEQRLVISTGLQKAATLTALRVERQARPEIALLHCVTAYPAPLEHLNLRQIASEKLDGLSDHAASDWIFSGALAVAVGASILEVHLKDEDTHAENPDAPHALTPRGFSRYVGNIRAAEAALGEQWRGEQGNPAEDQMRPYRVQP